MEVKSLYICSVSLQPVQAQQYCSIFLITVNNVSNTLTVQSCYTDVYSRVRIFSRVAIGFMWMISLSPFALLPLIVLVLQRPVSTQENKHRTGLFSILYYPHRRTKKVENTSTLYHKITGSNWNRKFAPKAHANVQFCYDPVRSHTNFPEWKPALTDYNISCNLPCVSLLLSETTRKARQIVYKKYIVHILFSASWQAE